MTDRHAGIYLVRQGTLGFAWWIMLWLVPASRLWFFPAERTDTIMLLVLPADLLLYCAGSTAAGIAVLRRNRAVTPLVYVTIGAPAYATLCAAAMGLFMDAGWAGAGMMAGALLLTSLCARIVSRHA